MSQKVTLQRSFNLPVHELFFYFTDPGLIERWSAPDGMTLNVPVFEFERGGRYRYEHTSSNGVYVCEGHLRKIVENEMIRMVDDEIRDPSGNLVAEKLSCDITFKQIPSGSEVTIVQNGFPNDKFANECKTSWNQCFNKLQDLVKDSGLKKSKSA